MTEYFVGWFGLALINGKLINAVLQRDDNRLSRLIARERGKLIVCDVAELETLVHRDQQD